MGIKYPFVWCAPYVVMTSRVTSQYRFLNICHDFRNIFCLLSSFVSAWCIWRSVTSYQMNWHSISFYSMCPSCGYEVTCDVTKPFSKIYNMIFVLLFSNFFCDRMLNFTSCHYTSNKLSFYVRVIWLWRRSSQSRFLNLLHDFRKTFCLLTLVSVHYAFSFRLRYIKWIGIQ